MKRSIAVWMGIVLACLLLAGCGGGGGDSAAAQDLLGSDTQNPPPGGGGTTPPPAPVPASLGALTDLGDLVAGDASPPPGDGWYDTQATAINDSGTVVGKSSMAGPLNPTEGAFRWTPAAGLMEFLGIHDGTFEDFFNQRIVVPIPNQHSFIFSETVDINNPGAIIGNSVTSTGGPDALVRRAFLWKDGVFIDLPPIPGEILTFRAPGTNAADDPGEILFRINSFSEAVDINNKGEIVLTLEDNTGQRHAYFWDGVTLTQNSLGRDDVSIFVVDAPDYIGLGRIIGQPSEAVAINENSQAVINSGSTAVFHDLNWDLIQVLNHLPGPGERKTVAVDINDSAFTNNDGISDGHVIGNSGSTSPGTLKISTDPNVNDPTVRGFFWDGGAMYPVDDLGGGTSEVTDLNNGDQVVGAATLADGSFHAILWSLNASKKGVVRDLGTLGGANSFATSINEAGQVTGWAETGQFYEEQGVRVAIRHAFLWSNGIMFDLGTHNDFYVYPFVPPFPFSEAVALNASGKVAGNSITINAHSRGFSLSPVFP